MTQLMEVNVLQYTFVFNIIGIWGVVGVINLAIIDYMLVKLNQIKSDSKLLNNKERLIILIFWPIYGLKFWYNFFKGWLNR
jgi:hypothetical protein